LWLVIECCGQFILRSKECVDWLNGWEFWGADSSIFLALGKVAIVKVHHFQSADFPLSLLRCATLLPCYVFFYLSLYMMPSKSH